jgi:hypothetical protein
VTDLVYEETELADALWQCFRARDMDAVLPLSELAICRFELETDPAMGAWLGQVLLTTAEQIGFIARGSARHALSRVLALQLQTLWHAARPGGPLAPLDARRRSSPAAGAAVSALSRSRALYARVTQAVRIYELLIERFGADADPTVRRIAVSAHIDLGPALLILGRYRAAIARLRADMDIDEESIAAVLGAANASAVGAYRASDAAAAALSTVLTVGGGPSSTATAAKASEVLQDFQKRAHGRSVRHLFSYLNRVRRSHDLIEES